MRDKNIPLDHGRLGPHVDFIASDDAVEAEQIRLLLQNPAYVAVNLIGAGLVGVIVWPLYPVWVVALWLALICLVSLALAALQHRFAGAIGDVATSPNWERVFTLTAFVAGCLWGLTASVILMTPDPIYTNFILFVLGGMMAGGIVCIAVNRRAMLAFILPTILPAIVALATRGGLVQIEMAMMLALFTWALAWTGRAINRSITENVRLRVRQELLLATLRSSEAVALRMARQDMLTGLANRVVFVEALEHALATAKRGEKSFAVLYLDLDHFKDVNDTLGHPVGDELLKSVADRLRANTRKTDTVARFGGDEFAIILADIGDPADAAILADKLIASFDIPFSVRGSEIHGGASIGIAVYGLEGGDAENLLSHADVALYRAKSEGRGGYRFFTDVMDTEVKMRVTLGAELRIAVDKGQLFLMYQPQVAIDTGRITGVEAVVRWRHPQRGILHPGLFIPIAEHSGIIAKLGHWVLWEACRQGKAWLDDGVAPVRISVNLSALQFRTPLALEADIAAALAETGLPPQMLELELTESVLMDASREHSELLQRLRKVGVTVAIDDFGTGYSSLNYLRKFPSNRIKIPQDFVSNMETTPGDAAIIKATIGLARELNIDIIAEGVETKVQHDLLRDWGCREVQGFFFARPLTAKDATAVLRVGKILPRLAGATALHRGGTRRDVDTMRPTQSVI